MFSPRGVVCGGPVRHDWLVNHAKPGLIPKRVYCGGTIMAMPTVQYTKTADGVRIAFHVLGKGPAVAILYPYHVNHLTLNWQVPLHRGASEYLARYFTVINL